MTNNKILLITPPFMQASSPYPAMPFLSSYLRDTGFECDQLDVNIDVTCAIFSSSGLTKIFDAVNADDIKDVNLKNIYNNRDLYIENVDYVVDFLRGNNLLLAYKIIQNDFIVKGGRFSILKHIKFDDKSIIDKAKFYASLFMDDLVDFIKNAVSSLYNMTSYGSSIAESQGDFGVIEKILSNDDVIFHFIVNVLAAYDLTKYNIFCITIPFPGNLIPTLKIAGFIKSKFPDKKIIIGGGYVNTDLTMLTDKTIFKYVDFISCGCGEKNLANIIRYISGESESASLTDVYFVENGKLSFKKGQSLDKIKKFYVPDYKSINFKKYFSIQETTNKMHALWSSGVFLKLIMARGCYHHGCNFCDTGLEYISEFVPDDYRHVVDEIESLVRDTGLRNFHFVDEAMPPSVIKYFCMEIIRRKINISWWGNIRYENAFDEDLTKLMKKSGCIAVSGGIESAVNRVLLSMNKKTKIENVIKVLNNFKKNGILTHGYFIYGFPGEKREDIFESLEIIRQMFLCKILDSAFYHKFCLTIHSNVYKNPDAFNIIVNYNPGKFGNNDVDFTDKSGIDYDQFASGIEKAVYNYNYNKCLNDDVMAFFENENYRIKTKPDFVKKNQHSQTKKISPESRFFWCGSKLRVEKIGESSLLVVQNSEEPLEYELPFELAEWLSSVLNSGEYLKVEDLQKNYPCGDIISFSDLISNELIGDLRKYDLLVL